MRNFSIGRILLALSTIVGVPYNLFLFFAIMIGGGFLSDPNGFFFWGMALIFLLGLVILVIAWHKIIGNSSSLLLPVIVVILMLIPSIVGILLASKDKELRVEQYKSINH